MPFLLPQNCLQACRCHSQINVMNFLHQRYINNNLFENVEMNCKSVSFLVKVKYLYQEVYLKNETWTFLYEIFNCNIFSYSNCLVSTSVTNNSECLLLHLKSFIKKNIFSGNLISCIIKLIMTEASCENECLYARVTQLLSYRVS